MSPRRLRTWIISAGTEEVVVAASSQREAVERLQATRRNWSLYTPRCSPVCEVRRARKRGDDAR